MVCAAYNYKETIIVTDIIHTITAEKQKETRPISPRSHQHEM